MSGQASQGGTRDTALVPWPWDSNDPDVADDEDSLPDSTEDDRTGWWDPPLDWHSTRFLDDRPEWDREPEPRLRVCRRCRDLDELDPLRHCWVCRAELGRCHWCGLDPIKYKRERACGTCYRWLRRNLAQVGFASAHEQLRRNALVRHTSRSKRL